MQKDISLMHVKSTLSLEDPGEWASKLFNLLLVHFLGFLISVGPLALERSLTNTKSISFGKLCEFYIFLLQSPLSWPVLFVSENLEMLKVESFIAKHTGVQVGEEGDLSNGLVGATDAKWSGQTLDSHD